jgi:hypothetical protein
MTTRDGATVSRVRSFFLALMVFYIGFFWVMIILDILYWLNY